MIRSRMTKSLAALLSGCLLAGAFSPPALALTFRLDEDEVVGNTESFSARYEDTFVALGRVYGLGYRELIDANPGVLPWVPGEGTEILLPLSFVLPSKGLDRGENIVLNLAEFRLYHFIPERQVVRAYAVGIGREGWETPASEARITGALQNPSWTPPESIRREQAARGVRLPSVVPPGPDNPLGEYAVTMTIPGYLFHGSNKQLGIGMRVSHGCVRLYDSDIEELATSIRPGIPVTIVNEPVKAGWRNGQLYLEVHPQLEEDIGTPTDLEQVIQNALARQPGLSVTVDWDKVAEVAARQRGVPEAVTVGGNTVADAIR